MAKKQSNTEKLNKLIVQIKHQRDETEQARKFSEQQFRTIADNTADAIISINAKREIIYWNKGAQKLFGYKSKEIIGKQATVIMPDRYKQRHIDGVARYIATGKSKYLGKPLEFEGLRKDGSEFPLELSVTGWKSQEQWFFTAIIRDATERTIAKNKLIEQERRYRALFEEAPDGIVLIDPSTTKPLEFNSKAHQQLGYTSEEFSRLTIFDIEAKETVEETKAHVIKVLREGKDAFETKHRTKDGQLRDVLVTAQTINLGKQLFLTFFHDITIRKQEAAKLKEAKALSDSLNDINAAISSTLDFNEIMQRVVTDSIKAMGVERSAILLQENDGWTVKYIEGFPKEIIGNKVRSAQVPHIALASDTKKPVIIDNAVTDKRVPKEIVQRYKTKSVLVIPLIVKEEVIGTINFSYASAPVSFTDAQVDFASKVAASTSLALENSRLYQIERHIAETLQESFIRPIPKIPKLKIATALKTAYETQRVGGDFYDVFELSNNLVAILIGDVAGKGIEAAGLTETIRSSVRTLAYIDPSPSFVFSKTNQSLMRQIPPGMFVTAVFLIINTATGRVRFSSAGHPPAILCDEDNCKAIDTPLGNPLGTFTDVYEEVHLKLKEKQTIILYTDGLTEAKRGPELFGEVGVLATLAKINGEAPQEIVDSLVRAATDFAQGKLQDDIALVAIRF